MPAAGTGCRGVPCLVHFCVSKKWYNELRNKMKTRQPSGCAEQTRAVAKLPIRSLEKRFERFLPFRGTSVSENEQAYLKNALKSFQAYCSCCAKAQSCAVRSFSLGKTLPSNFFKVASMPFALLTELRCFRFFRVCLITSTPSHP